MNKHLLIALSFLFPLHVQAQIAYEYDWKKEASLFGTGLVALGGSVLIDRQRDPLVLPPVSASELVINRLDQRALNNYSSDADLYSDVLFYGSTLAPLGLLINSSVQKDYKGFLMMYSEVVVLNAGITLLVKAVSDRKRPYHYNTIVPTEIRIGNDARKSFFSGHTSHTAALCFFGAQVYSDIYSASKFKPLVWTIASSIPAATAYFRVRAGQHYPTDVIVGYGVGAGIGILIPIIHRSKKLAAKPIKLTAISNGFVIVWRF